MEVYSSVPLTNHYARKISLVTKSAKSIFGFLKKRTNFVSFLGFLPTSRDPGDDQLSEYGDDSGDFAVEEDGANRDMQNEELDSLFESRGTQSGRGGTTRKALLLDVIFQNVTVFNFCLKPLFP